MNAPAPNRKATPDREAAEEAEEVLDDANRPEGVPPDARPNTPLPVPPTPGAPTPEIVPDRAPPAASGPVSPVGQTSQAGQTGQAGQAGQAGQGGPAPPRRAAVGSPHPNDAAAAAPPLRVERDERGVYTLTLARPQAYNALSEAMLESLQAALDRVAADAQARCVVVAAEGRAFCSGHDLKEMRAEPSLGYYDALFAQCAQAMLSIQRLPVPVLARVHGTATAAGCQLVAQCDLAVASSDARFAVSGVNLGLFCSTPAVALARNVPRKAAFEMLVGGDFIDAGQALARGLVNRVVAPDELDAAVEAMVAKIVGKPRAALALGKALFYRQLETGIEAAYEDAGRTMAANMMDAGALEGVQAFLDKRPAAWAAH